MRNIWYIFKRELGGYFATPSPTCSSSSSWCWRASSRSTRQFLRTRAGRSAGLLLVPPVALSVPDPRDRDAAVVRGTPRGHDRIVPHTADHDRRSGDRQVPRRVGLRGHRARPHLPDLDHRQPAGRSRQRHHPGELRGLGDDERGLPWRSARRFRPRPKARPSRSSCRRPRVSPSPCRARRWCWRSSRAGRRSFLVDAIAGFSFLAHFNAITRGVIDLRDIVFFASLVAAFPFANAAIVDIKKAG